MKPLGLQDLDPFGNHKHKHLAIVVRAPVLLLMLLGQLK